MTCVISRWYLRLDIGYGTAKGVSTRTGPQGCCSLLLPLQPALGLGHVLTKPLLPTGGQRSIMLAITHVHHSILGIFPASCNTGVSALGCSLLEASSLLLGCVVSSAAPVAVNIALSAFIRCLKECENSDGARGGRGGRSWPLTMFNQISAAKSPAGCTPCILHDHWPNASCKCIRSVRHGCMLMHAMLQFVLRWMLWHAALHRHHSCFCRLPCSNPCS